MTKRNTTLLVALLACPACNAEKSLGEVGADEVGADSVREDIDGFRAVVITRGRAEPTGLASAAPGDLNADGFDDLVVAYAHGDSTSMCQFFGGPELFASLDESEADLCSTLSHETQPQVLDWPIRPLSFGDLDGDSIADFGVWEGEFGRTMQLRVFSGGPQGAFESGEPPLNLGLPADGVSAPLQPADIDGDGLLDFITPLQGDDVPFAVVGIGGDALIAAAAGDQRQPPPSKTLAIADEYFHFDAGVLGNSPAGSLVGYHSPDGGPFVVRGTPDRFDASVEPEVLSELVAPASSIRFGTMVDWDCDGRDEIVSPIRNQGGTLNFFDGSEDPEGVPQTSVLTLDVPNSIQGTFSVGDVDGDGCEDLLVETVRDGYLGLVLVYGGEQPATGGEVPLTSHGTAWFDRGAIKPAGDINGDGYGDVIVAISGNLSQESLLSGEVLDEGDPTERLILMYGEPR